VDVRRIDLTPRSLKRSPWWWIENRAKRAVVSIGFVAPLLGIIVVALPGSQPSRVGATGLERTSFLAPLQQVIRLAVEHPFQLTVTPTPAPAPPPASDLASPRANPPVGTPAPQPSVDSSSAAAWAASPGVACIRQHESGDGYSANTGNGYYGAYQDQLSTWQAAGGTGLPSDAPPAVQDQINYQIWLSGGWGQWGTASICGL